MAMPRSKRFPAWSTLELLDLISILGESAVQSQPRSSQRNFDTYGQISRARVEKGYKRDALQCQAKIKELRQSYQKAREANHRSGVAPMSCRFYKELEALLSGDPTSTSKTPVDTFAAPGTPDTILNPEEEVIDEDVELEDDPEPGSSSVAEVGSQELFLTPEGFNQPQPFSSGAQDAGEGSSGNKKKPSCILLT